MRDPRPVFWLVAVQALLLLALAGWWFNLTRTERLAHLRAVMRDEHVLTTPPDGLWAQGVWLTTHRRGRLQGMVGLGVVAVLVGAGEGIVRRRQDPLGGFLLTLWTLGVVGIPLGLGALGGYLLAPWPLPEMWVASGLALLVTLVVYGLTAGRPYVP
jgi:hypothetical protein